MLSASRIESTRLGLRLARVAAIGPRYVGAPDGGAPRVALITLVAWSMLRVVAASVSSDWR